MKFKDDFDEMFRFSTENLDIEMYLEPEANEQTKKEIYQEPVFYKQIKKDNNPIIDKEPAFGLPVYS